VRDGYCETELAECAWLGKTYLCRACRQKEAERAQAEKQVFCADCKRTIGPGKAGGAVAAGANYCDACWNQVTRNSAGKEAPRANPVQCKKCGKNVEEELGKGCRGDYICEECRERAAEDPAELLYVMLREAGLIEAGAAKPKSPVTTSANAWQRRLRAVYKATNAKRAAPSHQGHARQGGVSPRPVRISCARSKPPNDSAIPTSSSSSTMARPEPCSTSSWSTARWEVWAPDAPPRRPAVAARAGPIMLQAARVWPTATSRASSTAISNPTTCSCCRTPASCHQGVRPRPGENFETAGFSGMTVTGQFAGPSSLCRANS